MNAASLAQLLAAAKPAQIPECVRHEFDIWCAGFDAVTRHEEFGEIPNCPDYPKTDQKQLWYDGARASRTMTQLSEELSKYESLS